MGRNFLAQAMPQLRLGRVPLLLGVWGPRGAGKTMGVALCCKARPAAPPCPTRPRRHPATGLDHARSCLQPAIKPAMRHGAAAPLAGRRLGRGGEGGLAARPPAVEFAPAVCTTLMRLPARFCACPPAARLPTRLCTALAPSPARPPACRPQRLGLQPYCVSAGELEDELAGEPGRRLRERYVAAARAMAQGGEPSCLVIDDADAGFGRVKDTQCTVNSQAGAPAACPALPARLPAQRFVAQGAHRRPLRDRYSLSCSGAAWVGPHGAAPRSRKRQGHQRERRLPAIGTPAPPGGPSPAPRGKSWQARLWRCATTRRVARPPPPAADRGRHAYGAVRRPAPRVHRRRVAR